MEGHRTAEVRSLAMHAAIAGKLRRDPALLERARGRVEAWSQSGAVHPAYVAAWRATLRLPIDALCAALVDPSEPARELRQVSPFAGALDPRERWRILRELAAGADRA